MVPSRMTGGLAQSLSSSGIFFQGDGQSQVAGNSQLSSNFVNSSNSLHVQACANLGPVSGDISSTILNGVASSIPSVGASSLVTDANSGLPEVPHLQRSASINTESHMRLPASPMSFSSNNICISVSSVMDASSMAQQSSNRDLGLQQGQKIQQHQGASISTSGDPRMPNSFTQDPAAISTQQKKPRLDVKQEDVIQQQVLQQLLRNQDIMQLQNPNPQLQALIQQQKLRQQQQQLLQNMPPMQRAQLLQQQQQLQLRQQLQQQGMPPASGVKRPYDGGVCSRRLMQYLYHQRQRTADNPIAYWRKFVAEYYSPRAKKRWCLSLYDNVGNHSLGVFPQAAMDAWLCDICGSKSGRGFEATFEVFPRLNEIKFGSGVIDELLFLDLPRECRFPSGMMMLEYGKAVQESVFEQLRVVREGQLRIMFTPDLKILSWEFCARRHEELLPRKLVAPQVNQLLQVAQKCQSTISESGSSGVSQSDIQANSAMVVTARRQLARSLELQSLNDLGFSKRYVRCLQIAEVVNSMKDLMDFCSEQKVGPTEGLKNIPRHIKEVNAQMQKAQAMEQMRSIQGPPADPNMLHKFMAIRPSLNSQMNNNTQRAVVGQEALSSSAQATAALSNYPTLLTRQNSTNSNHNSVHLEASSPFSTASQPRSSMIPTSSGILPRALQIPPVGGFSSCHLPQQQQVPQHSSGGNVLQQHMIQQLLQDMSNKNSGGAVPQQSLSVHNNSGGNWDARELRNSDSPAAVNGPGNVVGQQPPSRSNSFKATANGESSAPTGTFGFSQKPSDLPHNLHLSDELVNDIAHEYIENGFFSNDFDDDMNFSWKP
ncbi:putative transcriptional regulator SLK2 isoform X1 [Primulina tabacum]|uniref:putative transcriptional regulator SLK2 isoform X1 n=1 Tax=Primulina tabacum TaxID=48773 RepID=UPI003F5A1264